RQPRPRPAFAAGLGEGPAHGGFRLGVRSRAVNPSHLDPEALAWAGLSWPSRPRLTGLIRQSGNLPPLPSRAGYRPALDIQGSSCLVSRPSELSLRDCPELPSSIRREPGACVSPFLPHRHRPSTKKRKLLPLP